MDITTTTFLFPLLFIVSLVFLGIHRLKTKNSTGKSPPGPWRLPILGNLHQLAFAGALPHVTMKELAEKHGPLMRIQLGELFNLVVSSADAAKDVMKTHDINFASRPTIVLSEILLYDNKGITFGRYGNYWRHLKKMAATELLSANRVKSFRRIREQETQEMVKYLGSNQGKAINFTDMVFSLVFGITATVTFGKKIDEQKQLLKIVTQATVIAAGVDISDLFPSFKFLRYFSKETALIKKILVEADDLFEKIVNEHKMKSLGDSGGGGGRGEVLPDEDSGDLVDVLLRYQKNPNSEFDLTNENIKALLMDLSIGGTDGSANSLNWGLAEMMKNPRILERAQDEVRKTFGKEGYIDEDKFDELHYIKAIVKETLRLHPPAPLLVPRENTDKTEINGYEIPARSKILINVWAIMRDPSYWEDAETFKPERFLGSLIDYRGTDFHYLPFGAGRRMCPGITYGWANVLLPLVKILYYFDWKLPTGINHQELDMTEEHGLAVRRKDDLYLIPTIHNPLPTSL